MANQPAPSPSSHWISLEGSPIIWGQGKTTLVFLHYFGGAAASWSWVIQQMEDYRCIAINLPGFGNRPALDKPTLQGYASSVAAELDCLSVDDYILVGHSMGGKIALQTALSSDRPPQHIVLIAPSPPAQEPMPDDEKQRLLTHHPSVDNAETTLSSATRRGLSDEQRRLAIQTHVMVESSAWRWWLLQGMVHSIADATEHLRTPVTVLASTDDPVIPYETIQRKVLAVIPESRIETISGIGHLIPLEAADWVATKLRHIGHRS